MLIVNTGEPVTLTDVKTALNYTVDTGADDNELQDFLDAAVIEIGKRSKELTETTYTEIHDGGDVSIYLRHLPVVSVAGITEVVGSLTYTLSLQPPGQSVDAWGFSLDNPNTGKIVRRSAAGQPWRFTPGIGNVTVTYTAGLSTVPANLRRAVLELVEHWWHASQQASAAAPGGGSIGAAEFDAVSTVPGSAFGIPYRVLDLLAQERGPVIS